MVLAMVKCNKTTMFINIHIYISDEQACCNSGKDDKWKKPWEEPDLITQFDIKISQAYTWIISYNIKWLMESQSVKLAYVEPYRFSN